MERVVSRTASGRKLLDLDVSAAARADPSASAWLVVRDETLLSPSSSPGAVMSFTIMREALMALLYAPLPAGTVQFGKQVARIEHRAVDADAGPMVVVFEDGSESGGFDLIVGCDGISSAVRQWVVGDEAAKYSGLRVTIGVAPAGNRPPDAAGEMRQFFSEDGAYALTATYGGGAGGPCEMVALTTSDEGGAMGANPLWDSNALRGDCVRRLEAAGMPNEVTAVAHAATRFFDIGVRFSNPLAPWTRSVGGEARAVLLGDAAHAMPPFLGQGANQALQDAFCLANELKREEAALRQALWRYQLIRKPTTALLMLESRFLGAVETQKGFGATLRDAFFWTTDKLGVAKFIFLKGAVPRVPKE
jgi:2-polyprenyl-6-methoxyphenol hydroxylase-like FAD-dependent oxidoreductase